MYVTSVLPQGPRGSFYFYDSIQPRRPSPSPDYEEVEEDLDDSSSTYDNMSTHHHRPSFNPDHPSRASIQPFFYEAHPYPAEYAPYRPKKAPAPAPPVFHYARPKNYNNATVQRSLSIAGNDYSRPIVNSSGVTVGRRSYFPVYRHPPTVLPPPPQKISVISAATLSRAAAQKLNLSTFSLASIDREYERQKNRNQREGEEAGYAPMKPARYGAIPAWSPPDAYQFHDQPRNNSTRDESKVRSSMSSSNFVSTISIDDTEASMEAPKKRPVKYATIRPSRPPPPPPYKKQSVCSYSESFRGEASRSLAEEFFQTGKSLRQKSISFILKTCWGLDQKQINTMPPPISTAAIRPKPPPSQPKSLPQQHQAVPPPATGITNIGTVPHLPNNFGVQHLASNSKKDNKKSKKKDKKPKIRKEDIGNPTNFQ